MPTLEDLHAAFAELERQAPTALSRPVRHQHRRRWVAAGLAAACTAAVAIAVPLAIDGSHRTPALSGPSRPHGIPKILVKHAFESALPAPATGHSPELTYGFAIPDTAGYTVVPDEITGSYQHATIYGPTDPPGGQVFVYYRNAFDPAEVTNRNGVTVGAEPGYFGDLKLPGASAALPVLAWQYAPDGWAVVRLGVDEANPAADHAAKNRRSAERRAAESQAQSAQVAHNALLLAEAMVPTSAPLHSPVRIPAGTGLHVRSMSSDAGPNGDIVLAGPGDTTYTLGWGPDELHAADKPNTSTTRLGGHDWIVYSDGSYGLIADHFGMTVVMQSSMRLPANSVLASIRRSFVIHLTVVPNPSDRTAWFEADSVLP